MAPIKKGVYYKKSDKTKKKSPDLVLKRMSLVLIMNECQKVKIGLSSSLKANKFVITHSYKNPKAGLLQVVWKTFELCILTSFDSNQ